MNTTVLVLAAGLCCAAGATAGEPGKARVAKGYLTVEVGDYRVKFWQKWAWTLRAADYRGKPFLVPGGVFQTVVNEKVPKGIDSFIGGGHRPESVESVELLVDGKPHKLKEGLAVEGTTFTVHKKTLIGAYYQDARVTVDAGGIDEDFRFEVKGDTSKVNLMYAFMHCFANDTRHWVAQLAGGDEARGEFADDMSFTLKKDILWTLVYAPKTGIGAAYVYPEAYRAMKGHGNKFWNRKHDNKLYLTVAPKRQRGDTFRYRVRLRAFAAPEESWEKVGRQTVEQLRKAFAEPSE